ncbi:type I restriction enzyme, S subunit [Roseovarius azorensis]|uniref:Type I restriction enzyme, S subunit n=1 Tax=Roseovarius azorensis TaxID=1287727 RepID=A0A1H7XJU6_9RHOB|nr:restriction endonuclease subunit S [Roseovarius azorensis]SEM33864.1 type I restriction enzyme, S subunit [Roseovarius azorensis]
MTDIMTLASPPYWQLHRLGQLFRERKEKGSDKDFPPLSVTMGGIVPQLETAAKTDDGDNRKVVRVGDYVINSRSDRKGSGGISDHEGSVSLISIVLEPRNIDPHFAHHLLRSPAFQEEFYRWGHGIVADLWTTRYADMKNIRLRVPDLATQRQIVDFLDRETARIDLLIEKKQRFIETLSESRLTAAPSVIRAFGGPEMKETPNIFDIHFNANGWSVGRVKHVVKLMTSGSRGWSDLIQDDGELFLQSGNIGRRNEIVLSEAKRIIPQTNAEARRTRLKDADTLVCITGGRTGAVGFLETVPEIAYVNQHICLLRPRPEKVYAKLLAQLLYSEIGQRQFSLFQYGLKQGLGFSQVGEVRLPIPPKDLQQTISSEIDRIFERIGSTQSLQERSIDRLKEYRSALITAAVTGQIDVATYAKSGTRNRRLDAIQEEMGA